MQHPRPLMWLLLHHHHPIAAAQPHPRATAAWRRLVSGGKRQCCRPGGCCCAPRPEQALPAGAVRHRLARWHRPAAASLLTRASLRCCPVHALCAAPRHRWRVHADLPVLTAVRADQGGANQAAALPADTSQAGAGERECQRTRTAGARRQAQHTIHAARATRHPGRTGLPPQQHTPRARPAGGDAKQWSGGHGAGWNGGGGGGGGGGWNGGGHPNQGPWNGGNPNGGGGWNGGNGGNAGWNGPNQGPWNGGNPGWGGGGGWGE
jgi:hypothetical protein